MRVSDPEALSSTLKECPVEVITLERTLTELDHVRLLNLLRRDERGDGSPQQVRVIEDVLDVSALVPSREVAPDVVTMGPVTLTRMTIVSVVIAVITLAAVSYFLLATRVGRATRAVSDSPALAAASGISVEKIVRIVWTLGAGLAGLGGVLMGLYLNATSWNMGGAMLLLMFSAVTLGGLGAAFGALAGSLVIGLVVEMSSLVIPNDMRYAGALLILILVLLFRPQGILGRAERIG